MTKTSKISNIYLYWVHHLLFQNFVLEKHFLLTSFKQISTLSVKAIILTYGTQRHTKEPVTEIRNIFIWKYTTSWHCCLEAALIISNQRYDMHIHTLQVTNNHAPLQEVPVSIGL